MAGYFATEWDIIYPAPFLTSPHSLWYNDRN